MIVDLLKENEKAMIGGVIKLGENNIHESIKVELETIGKERGMIVQWGPQFKSEIAS